MENDTTPDQVGQLAREKRIELSLSQKQLSQLCGVAQPTISNFEKGNDTGASAMDKILTALGIKLELRFPREFKNKQN